MNRFLRISFTISILIFILFSMVPAGEAQDPTPPPTSEPEGDFLPFSILDKQDIILRGPYSGTNVRFTLPSSWKIEATPSLILSIDAAFSNLESLNGRSAGANLQITYNDISIASLFITQQGEQTFTIPIPLEAMVSGRLDGRHDIEFELDAAFDCEFPHETVIVIRSSSGLNLPHTLIPAKADLSILPRPFYQQDTFLPESAFLVVPNNPTSAELQSAITVAAAFGRMSSGELNLNLIRVEELTLEMRTSSHLIFVGNSKDFLSFLQQASFPATQAEPGDGILQAAVSPWNSSRIILKVTGTDETGLLKAAQALTFGIIQPGTNPQTAVISGVNPTISEQLVADVRTFASLGYPTTNANGFGVTTLEYVFYMPPGFVVGDDPHLNMIFTHSALLDFANSGVVITLNDQRIGSLQLTKETAAQINTLKIPLYGDLIRPGNNRLAIQVNLLPVNICSTFSDRGIWFTVNSSSQLNLPLLPAEPSLVNASVSLTQYPHPFTASPTLGDVGFVLSKEDPNSWKFAARLASQLGRRATGQLLTPQLGYNENLSNEFLQNHLIVVGTPSKLPILSQMTDAMPAPFEPGSNIVTERTLTVEYRLPAETSLGYIELFSSPWNVEKMVITVLGSTSEGLDWALNALTVPALKNRVTGNFVVVSQSQINATDTRVNKENIVPGAQPIQPTLAAENNPTPPDEGAVNVSTSNWIFPTIISITIITIGLILFVVVRAYSQAKTEK